MAQIIGDTEDRFRRARINRLKKIILITAFVLVMIPNLLCIGFAVSLFRLNGKIDRLSERLNMLEETSDLNAEQKAYAPHSVDSTQVIPQNVDSEAETDREVPLRDSDTENVLQKTKITEEEKDHAHLVYLTFDDGPSIYTDEILDILEEYEVKATFFVVGKQSEKNKERLKRIVEEGHTLGMHSFSHKYAELYATEESFAEDFHRIQDYLYEVTGVKSRFYRFPGGSSNTVSAVDMHKLVDFLEKQDVTYFDWNISSQDAENTTYTVDQLVVNSMKNIEKYHTSVILFHDSASKHSTVEALPQVIENILALEDTVILPITDKTEPVHHKMK